MALGGSLLSGYLMPTRNIARRNNSRLQTIATVYACHLPCSDEERETGHLGSGPKLSTDAIIRQQTQIHHIMAIFN